jgi:sugar phosphate isomerase/epimerase
VPRILASTTSHKREPLLPTLEVFARLGLCDLDLNLGHLVEGDTPVDAVARALATNGQRVWMVSGGWCDFYHDGPQLEETLRSVDRQVGLARQLGVATLRLFYGRLPREDWGPAALDVIGRNLSRLSDCYGDMTFVFENHGHGAASQPEMCRAVLDRVDRLNVRMNFDPVNFEHAGVDSMDALAALGPLIGHVHLKGSEDGRCCEFGAGEVDLTPLIRSLVLGGYAGSFTVEYEGTFDRTVRLYRSVQEARRVVGLLTG